MVRNTEDKKYIKMFSYYTSFVKTDNTYVLWCAEYTGKFQDLASALFYIFDYCTTRIKNDVRYVCSTEY